MIVGVLEDKKPTKFFNDEFRSPIYVQVLLALPACDIIDVFSNVCWSSVVEHHRSVINQITNDFEILSDPLPHRFLSTHSADASIQLRLHCSICSSFREHLLPAWAVVSL